jgi:hypothetical protein
MVFHVSNASDGKFEERSTLTLDTAVDEAGGGRANNRLRNHDASAWIKSNNSEHNGAMILAM